MPDAVQVITQQWRIEVVSGQPSIIEIITGPPGPEGPPGNIHVGTEPPPNPEINDLWVDTN